MLGEATLMLMLWVTRETVPGYMMGIDTPSVYEYYSVLPSDNLFVQTAVTLKSSTCLSTKNY